MPRIDSFLAGADTANLILRHFWYDLKLLATRFTVLDDKVAGRVNGKVIPLDDLVSTEVAIAMSVPSVSLRILIVAAVEPELKNSIS
jgi:hypothetical protein